MNNPNIDPLIKPVIEAATKVVRAAAIGDQNFIRCLQGSEDRIKKLRIALVELSDALRELP